VRAITELAATKERLAQANARIRELQADVDGIARIMNVLALENEQRRSAAPGAGVLRLLPQ
jgi:hypothetical protein